ncbi:MAG TPA: glycoside hydrolase family 127 protein [Prolixibacteraceae bacterium]|nr:glycoside hydrolase family 127 protein [Prolixibacteraceae bacterium]
MKIIYVAPFLLLIGLVACKSQPEKVDYKIQGVPFNEVKISDQFWLPKIETNRTVTIPASFAKCEETGRIANFVKAAKKEGEFGTEFPFDDTDIYKTIEGASYSMSVHPDPKLDRYVDSLITIIGKAQEPDGYLYTARTIDPEHPHKWSGSERWVNESILSHELYNSGHLFEAASAHYQATGKRNFLDIALKNADLLDQVFGPGKRNDAPGHEIVEMGLVKLYRITGEKKYLNLAKFFIDSRGKENDPKKAYSQDHKPLIEQDEAVGHAVRAGYLYSGVADVAALTGDSAYLAAIDKIWENMVSKKLYITGGIGARHAGEAFGDEYELPNLTAYNETCAAIANVYWNYRMFLLHGDSKYIDVLERSLYNGVISGVGLDGKTFFYPNPLECDMHYHFNSGETLDRQPWFDCSCCPTNMCRFLPSVPGYIYAQGNSSIFVNLFVQSSSTIPLNKKLTVAISQETQYPWTGQVKITVSPEKTSKFALCLRIPGWAENQAIPSDLYSFITPESDSVSVTVNGETVPFKTEKGYAVIDREWNQGDMVNYTIPMSIRRVVANQKVSDDLGKVVLERGPIVYCLEGVDNGAGLNTLALPDSSKLTSSFNSAELSGIVTISGDATIDNGKKMTTQKITAIPYFVWNNRGANEMKVWIPRN